MKHVLNLVLFVGFFVFLVSTLMKAGDVKVESSYSPYGSTTTVTDGFGNKTQTTCTKSGKGSEFTVTCKSQ